MPSFSSAPVEGAEIGQACSVTHLAVQRSRRGVARWPRHAETMHDPWSLLAGPFGCRCDQIGAVRPHVVHEQLLAHLPPPAPILAACSAGRLEERSGLLWQVGVATGAWSGVRLFSDLASSQVADLERRPRGSGRPRAARREPRSRPADEPPVPSPRTASRARCDHAAISGGDTRSALRAMPSLPSAHRTGRSVQPREQITRTSARGARTFLAARRETLCFSPAITALTGRAADRGDQRRDRCLENRPIRRRVRR